MKKHLIRIANGILDSCFGLCTPLWRRKGVTALSSINRYINYFRPRIKAERMTELTELCNNLRESLHAWDKDAVQRHMAAAELLEESLPGYKRNALAEMVESLFVIGLVFMGIRTYYTQPFRIPTGSMQPSLNGIIIHPIEEIPSAPERWWNALALGSSYVDETAGYTKCITGMRQEQKWVFFTQTVLQFDDGSTLDIPCAQGAVMQYLRDRGKLVSTPLGLQFRPFRAGETIMKARVDAGDMVFVNRMAYHFRKPQRGETFVFDTRGINTSSSATALRDQSGGTHYIKRLCGLPGDTLEIRDPQLIVNGEVAEEPTIRRVMAGQAPYNKEGYQVLSFAQHPQAYLTTAGAVKLQSPEDANLREYVALGDNTTNSLDSRYWGPVHQFNLLGPACFTLWPFTTHWGTID